MTVVDSVGWIAYISGGDLAGNYRPYVAELAEIVTPTIVVYEVYKTLSRNLGARAAYFGIAPLYRTMLVPLDAKLALAAAEVSAAHRLPMADAIVYATARSYGAVLVTSDKHFEGLVGVHYIPRNSSSQ